MTEECVYLHVGVLLGCVGPVLAQKQKKVSEIVVMLVVNQRMYHCTIPHSLTFVLHDSYPEIYNYDLP